MAIGDEIFRGFNMRDARSHGATPASEQAVFRNLRKSEVVPKLGGYGKVFKAITEQYPEYADAFRANWGEMEDARALERLNGMMFDYYYGFAGNQGETYLYFDMGTFQTDMNKLYEAYSRAKGWRSSMGSQRGIGRRGAILTPRNKERLGLTTAKAKLGA